MLTMVWMLWVRMDVVFLLLNPVHASYTVLYLVDVQQTTDSQRPFPLPIIPLSSPLPIPTETMLLSQGSLCFSVNPQPSLSIDTPNRITHAARRNKEGSMASPIHFLSRLSFLVIISFLSLFPFFFLSFLSTSLSSLSSPPHFSFFFSLLFSSLQQPFFSLTPRVNDFSCFLSLLLLLQTAKHL